MIIIFVAVVLVLGTGKLPGAAKKMGKVVSEYNNAKNEIQQQMKEVNEEVPKISGPVETEREKLEMIAKSAGIKTEDKIVQAVLRKMDQRSLIGQKKYGATMMQEIEGQEKDLNRFLVDVQEELMDAILYIQAAREEMQDMSEELLLKNINVYEEEIL